MDEAIITIKEAHTIENVISKSRFIAHIQPVETEAEAKNFIKSIKSQHHEATHNCSAYTVGDQMNIQKANDDDEPSGTAGIPMLEVLKKLEVHKIENVISKSRFIAHIQPVETEAEAKNFIKSIKSQHHEATHNCSAYTVGDQMNIQKANDDGEPSGTAGIPMLEVLKKLEVH